ncbi:MAG TPA: TetR/AcrR family transcriptional regulator [Arachidicoccus sp.]
MTNETISVKDRIIKASKEVFRRYGYVKVSMEDIATATGMGRSSLYHYYESKRDVFEDVVAEEISEVLDVAIQKISRQNTLEDNFIKYNQVKIKQVNLKLREFNHIIQDLRRDSELLYQTRKSVRIKEEKVLKRIILWGIENNEIPESKIEDMEVLVSAIMDAFSVFDHELFLFGKVDKFTSRLKNMTAILCKWLN